MKVKQITDLIEQFAPLELQEDYDNSGLIVGRYDQEVEKILLAVDVTDEVMDEAMEKHCEMILTHHPVIFHGQKRFNSQTQTQRLVERAIREGVVLYAAHTNLDAAKKGMSWRLGEILGLRQMQCLENKDESGSGFGVVGRLQKDWEIIPYLKFVKKTLGCDVIRCSDLNCLKVPLSCVAICTGAGASMMELAAKARAQLYLTADLKYNDFYVPDGRFVVADVGHFESERCAIDILFDILSKKISKFALHRSISARTPIHCI